MTVCSSVGRSMSNALPPALYLEKSRKIRREEEGKSERRTREGAVEESIGEGVERLGMISGHMRCMR